MLSRLAENLYWLGRYLERAENTARVLAAQYFALAGAPAGQQPTTGEQNQWRRLLDMHDGSALFDEHVGRCEAQAVAAWMAFSLDNPSSIRRSLQWARENGRRGLRYHLNLEMWEALNRSYLQLFSNTEQVLEEERLADYCGQVREASHLFFGIAEATLPRDMGWHFLEAGRYLERCDNVLRALGAGLHLDDQLSPGVAPVQLRTFLKSMGAYEACRKRCGPVLDPVSAERFLLTDSTFPRSARCAAGMLRDSLEAIARHNVGAGESSVQLAGWLWAQLEYGPPELLAASGTAGRLLDELMAVADAVASAHFSDRPTPEELPVQQQ